MIPEMGMNDSDFPETTPLPLASKRRNDGLVGSPLTDALFTTTQQRVLALLFGQPDRSFFVTEIIRLAGSGRGAVQRELRRLAESGLATVLRIGNQKHFQANRDSPLFHELCSIIRKTVGLKEPVRAALQPLADKLKLALLYGSVAKQADTAASDIDLLLVSDELTLEATYATLAPVEKRLDRHISPTLYTSSEFRHRRATEAGFLTRVLQGPYIVLKGSVDAA